MEDEKNVEEELYEKLCKLAEEAPERKLLVLVRSEAEIKAAYRAAVYGKISLLFGEIFTEEEAERAKEKANRAFCELIEEKREFNGFIPKGILIDTPLALLSKISPQGFDFFCYDTEKIASYPIEKDKNEESAEKYRQDIEALISKAIESDPACYTINEQFPIEKEIWVWKE